MTRTRADLTENLNKMSGFAGTIHGINASNLPSSKVGGASTEPEKKKEAANICAGYGITGLLAFGIVVNHIIPSFIIKFYAIGSALTAVVHIGSRVYKNKGRFFVPCKTSNDLEERTNNIASSFFVSIYFAVEHCVAYLVHIYCALSNLIQGESTEDEFAQAGEALNKIFPNLAAALFNPLINIIDLVGSYIIPNKTPVEDLPAIRI